MADFVEDEKKVPFCRRCKSEQKAKSPYCSKCHGIVLYLTKDQIDKCKRERSPSSDMDVERSSRKKMRYNPYESPEEEENFQEFTIPENDDDDII